MQADKGDPGHSLAALAGYDNMLQLNPQTEAAWIEVIQKMDEVYADLIRYQVELEQKNTELESAQQFIRGVLSAMTDVLIVCDVNGRIEQVNAAAARLTGRGEAECIGLSLSALFCDDSQPMMARFPEHLGSDSIIDCEVNLRGPKDRAVPLAMNCSPRRDNDGRVAGMVLIGRPVGELRRAYQDLAHAHEELKQTQRQLVHSEKMASLGRLVAGVAHELNNPISFVFGNMHALKRYGDRIGDYLQAVEQRVQDEQLVQMRKQLKIDRIQSDMGSLIDGTLEGAERVSDIVQDLRRYSSGQTEAAADYDLSQVIHTATAWVTKACRVKPQVDYRLPDRLPVIGRKGQVHQILVNLVQNAVDVMEERERPRIEITGDHDARMAHIRVRDYGPGLSDEQLIRVFDPFYTTKPVGKGTGLGLYISYGLAQDLGGDLIASNHPDGGAVFSLSVPLEGGGRD